MEKKFNMVRYSRMIVSILGGNKPQSALYMFYGYNLLDTFLKPCDKLKGKHIQ